MSDSPRPVLITGCSSGIGLATARLLREQGFQVIASARDPEDVERLREEGLTTVRLDLADPDSIREGAAAALELAGGALYGLFNNGAYGQAGAVEDITTAVLRAQFEPNFFGAHELTRLVLPGMLARGRGRIVQCSSVLGFISLPLRGAYCASKYALEALSDALRLELAGTGVRVVLIEPGPIATDFRTNSLAAFLHNVDVEASRHRQPYRERLLPRLQSETPGAWDTLPPEAVARVALRAFTRRWPSPRYRVTWSTHLAEAVRRLLPYRLLDLLAARQ